MGVIRDAIEAKGMTTKEVAIRCQVSELLIRMLDAGHVTHPRIARRVAKLLSLTPEQEEMLKPEVHRGQAAQERAKETPPAERPANEKPKPKPEQRPMHYQRGSTVLIESDPIWKDMKRKGITAKALSLMMEKSMAWMSLCLKTGRMNRMDAIKVARVLDLRLDDILWKAGGRK